MPDYELSTIHSLQNQSSLCFDTSVHAKNYIPHRQIEDPWLMASCICKLYPLPTNWPWLTYLFSCHGKRSIEPLLEGGTRLEDSGQQEIQQSPQLWKFVLQQSLGKLHLVKSKTSESKRWSPVFIIWITSNWHTPWNTRKMTTTAASLSSFNIKMRIQYYTDNTDQRWDNPLFQIQPIKSKQVHKNVGFVSIITREMLSRHNSSDLCFFACYSMRTWRCYYFLTTILPASTTRTDAKQSGTEVTLFTPGFRPKMWEANHRSILDIEGFRPEWCISTMI